MAFDISPRRGLGKLLLRFAMALLVAYGLLLLVAQLDAWRDRHQAERLRDEMRSLSVGQSKWNDLQATRTRWGKWGDYEGECTFSKCDYTVKLGIPPNVHLSVRMLIWALIWHLGHRHFMRASLNVVVENGIVEHTSYTLYTKVPHGYGPRWEAEEVAKSQMEPYSTGEYGYTLIARASQEVSLDEYMRISPVHPHYWLTRPSGCEGCLAIWTVYTDKASPVEMDRMTDFNFSCITRWVPCKDEEDIMPDAGKEYLLQGIRSF